MWKVCSQTSPIKLPNLLVPALSVWVRLEFQDLRYAPSSQYLYPGFTLVCQKVRLLAPDSVPWRWLCPCCDTSVSYTSLSTRHYRHFGRLKSGAAATAALVMSDSARPHRRQPTRLLCPWVLQAGALERVAVSFSQACMHMLSRFSHVWLCATLWTEALQATPSRGFSRQEYM